MPLWIQHLLALLFVLACAAFVVLQAIRTLKGRGSLGCNCKSCPAARRPAPGQRTVFLPAELLKRKR